MIVRIRVSKKLLKVHITKISATRALRSFCGSRTRITSNFRKATCITCLKRLLKLTKDSYDIADRLHHLEFERDLGECLKD